MKRIKIESIQEDIQYWIDVYYEDFQNQLKRELQTYEEIENVLDEYSTRIYVLKNLHLINGQECEELIHTAMKDIKRKLNIDD